MLYEEKHLEMLNDIKKLLKTLIDKSYSRSNTHSFFTFDTSLSATLRKDTHELLGLPKGYHANQMTIIDIGGGFTYSINGQMPVITAVKGMSISQEEINRIEFIPAASAGTAIVRFAGFIER